MPVLSVIIVNYNVKHFLEQCIYSVQAAARDLETEIIVVDNHSSDGSMLYLPPKFPAVQFKENNENMGFAKACNQGLAMAKGRYILFLNPDTIVPEDCFVQCIQFMQSHPRAGGLGVRMIDGSGKFLKESKRSFPSPLTSLYKLFGLSRLFPHSRIFSRYHLGHLPEHSNNEVDVLAGAFMMIPREVLDKTGGFDENFFMYGEDVDLSFRIQQAGYSNYYFADSSIIHFKGESTRKGSMNYVKMFYTAMSQFVRKHYGGSRASLFTSLIHAGIWFRAGLTAIGGFIRRFGLPLIDAGLILLSFWLVKNGWNSYVKTEVHYENRLLWIAFPSFTVFYLLAAYYAGLYDRWYKRSELISSTIIATLVLLAGYALLPEQYRFSRGIILFGALLSFIMISILRWLLVRFNVLDTRKEKEAQFTTLVVASPEEYKDVLLLLQQAGLHQKMLGRIAVNVNDGKAAGYWKNLDQLVATLPYKEIIYCSGTLRYADILQSLQQLPAGTRSGICASGSSSVVGSRSANAAGESLSKENGFNLSNPYNKRLKRLTDVTVALLSLLFFPLQFLLQRKPGSFFKNCFRVLLGSHTWIGYALPSKGLPPLRKGIMAANGIPVKLKQPLTDESLQMMDHWYARDYDPVDELKLIRKLYRRLGG
jgi:GT2 family glycosyltransferase